jgi:hypothetical protein
LRSCFYIVIVFAFIVVDKEAVAFRPHLAEIA